MFRYQKGLTTIGWLVLLVPLAIVVYAGIRVAPLYLNYMNVARTLNQVASAYETGGASPAAIRQSIEAHFMIDEVDYPSVRDIAISRSRRGWQLEAAYYDDAHLFGPITLRVKFDKTVTFGNSGGG
jgi:hypothetical protein